MVKYNSMRYEHSRKIGISLRPSMVRAWDASSMTVKCIFLGVPLPEWYTLVIVFYWSVR